MELFAKLSVYVYVKHWPSWKIELHAHMKFLITFQKIVARLQNRSKNILVSWELIRNKTVEQYLFNLL